MFVMPLPDSSPANLPVPVPDLVTITGATISATVSQGTPRAKLLIVQDGTLWRETTNGGSVQISVATDWIIPNSAASSLYEVRYTNKTGNILQFAAFAEEDEWVAINASKEISQFAFRGGIFRTSSFDLEIRLNGGPVLATGFFTLNATFQL